MSTLMLMALLSSITFISLKHPLSMGGMLLIQTTCICMITGMMSFNFWYSYILFLVMIGGLLVLFIYMTSTASYEKFKLIYKKMITSLIIVIIILIMKFINPMNTYPIKKSNSMIKAHNIYMEWSMNKYLNFPSNLTYLMLVIYLLITLIAMVKIAKSKNGPLRNK